MKAELLDEIGEDSSLKSNWNGGTAERGVSDNPNLGNLNICQLIWGDCLRRYFQLQGSSIIIIIIVIIIVIIIIIIIIIIEMGKCDLPTKSRI